MKLPPRIEALAAKIDGMSLRERALIFIAAAFLVVSLIDSFLLSPLFAEHKRLSAELVQQQEKIKEIQAQIAALIEAKHADANSPLRERIRQLQQQLAGGEAYLKDRRDRLVPPDRMAALLEQMLSRHGGLELVAMDTLPVAPLIEGQEGTSADASMAQVFKHGVTMTVRGSYAEVLQYLTALEKLPTQMFWGAVKMKVVRYPTLELTMTLYTLGLERTWMQL